MKKTDLLFGIVSFTNGKDRHFFLADFDNATEIELMEKIGKILIDKHKFGVCYLIKSGKGYHVLNFTEKLTLEKYIELLQELESDPLYIKWVKKVGYGVLRISRRSIHMKVPKLRKVLLSPYKNEEDISVRNFYFMLLRLEMAYASVKRIIVKEEEESLEKELERKAKRHGFKLVRVEKNDKES